MGRNRSEKTELNFDGLTDCITNLAGSLVLLVVLIFAISKPKETGSESPRYNKNQLGAEMPMSSLLDKLESMRNDLQRLQRDTESIGQRLPEISSDIEHMEQKGKKK